MPIGGGAFNLKFISGAGSLKQGNIRFPFFVSVQIDVATATFDGHYNFQVILYNCVLSTFR